MQFTFFALLHYLSIREQTERDVRFLPDSGALTQSFGGDYEMKEARGQHRFRVALGNGISEDLDEGRHAGEQTDLSFFVLTPGEEKIEMFFCFVGAFLRACICTACV